MSSQKSEEPKVILITGSNRSIGKYIAQYYLNRGDYVVGCSRNACDITMDNYYHFSLDISDEPKVLEMFNKIQEKFQRLDVLVNNAGIYFSSPSVLTSMMDVEEVFRTNVFGVYLFCRESYKLMMDRKSGSIINISSIAVPLGSAGTSVYGSSKAAVEQLSKVLAKEFIATGINVNTLGFSIVEHSGMAQQMGERVSRQTLEQTVSKKNITFEEIVHAIDFFIAKENRHITGQIQYMGL